ncbi:MAG: hypothetical protein ACYDEA_10200 [Candidatus Dormibacteria bacterium]
MRLSPPLTAILLVAASTLGVFALTHAVWANPTATVLGGGADGVQKMWFMSWFAFAVTHGQDPLVTTFLSVPGHPINLMRNNAVPLWGLLMLPVTLSAGAVLSLNLATLLSLIAGPVVAAMVFRRYVQHPPTAWFAGFAFGLSPIVRAEAQLGHLSWISLWILPLTLLLLDEILIRQRYGPRRLGVALGALLSGELLINQELEATTVTIAALLLFMMAVYYRRRIVGHVAFAAKAIAAGVVVLTILCAFPLWIEHFGPGHAVHGANLNPVLFSADLLGFVLPNSLQLLSPAWATATSAHFTGNPADTSVYLGLPLLAAVALGWARYRSDPWVRWAAILTVLAMVLAMGSQLHVGGRILDFPLPWALIARLPLLGLALPYRVVVFALLGSCLCLAIVVDRLWSSPNPLAHVGAAAFLCTAAIFFAPQSTLYVQELAVPRFFTGASHVVIPSGSYAAVVPVPTDNNQADAMLWQFSSGFQFRLPWSYAIQAGPAGAALVGTADNPVITTLDAIAGGQRPPLTLAPKLVRYLELWQVRTIVVGPMPGEARVIAWWTAALQKSPKWYGSIAIWRLHGPVAAATAQQKLPSATAAVAPG